MSKENSKKADAFKLNDLDSATRDPYKVIEGFFFAASLQYYRSYISSMLKAVYSDGYWNKSDPGSLLRFQDQMEKLMIAVHSFIKQGKSKSAHNKRAILKDADLAGELDPLTYYGWHRNSAMWEFFPRSLSKKEFLDPYLVFERFFRSKSIRQWLLDFRQLISYALTPDGSELALEYDFLRIHQLLQKLVEAAHLIEVRLNKPGRPSK